MKLVGVGLARATRRASGTPYEKTASETTAIDALNGAKTRLYSPSRPPATHYRCDIIRRFLALDAPCHIDLPGKLHGECPSKPVTVFR